MLAFTGLMALLVIGGGTWVIRNRGHLEGETNLIFARLRRLQWAHRNLAKVSLGHQGQTLD